MLLFRTRRKAPVLDDLRSSIQATTHRTFELTHFRRLLAVVPENYTHRWEKIERDYRLLVDFPQEQIVNDLTLAARTRSVRERLLGRTRELHSAHLRARAEAEGAPKLLEFDPDRAGAWHSSFDAHSVPEVEPA